MSPYDLLRGEHYADEDTHSGSRRADIFDALGRTDIDKTEGAHRRFATLRVDLNRADNDLDRLFKRYDDCVKEMREQGVAASMILSPKMEAAYKAWRADAEQETKVALTEIPEAPMMPLEDELGT